MQITNVHWFTTMHAHTIGIVIGVDKITKKQKAYIGLGDGVDEEADKKRIAHYGSPFPLDAALKLFKGDAG